MWGRCEDSGPWKDQEEAHVTDTGGCADDMDVTS